MILEPSLPEFTVLDNICFLILVTAGLNWGLFAFFDINLVLYVTDNMYVHQMVYGIIVFAALRALFFWKKCVACAHSY